MGWRVERRRSIVVFLVGLTDMFTRGKMCGCVWTPKAFCNVQISRVYLSPVILPKPKSAWESPLQSALLITERQISDVLLRMMFPQPYGPRTPPIDHHRALQVALLVWSPVAAHADFTTLRI